MALLERVSTLVRANLNDLIDKAEHPEKMIKQVILDMHNQLLQVKTQVAIAIADQHLLEKKRKENEDKVAEWMRKAGAGRRQEAGRSGARRSRTRGKLSRSDRRICPADHRSESASGEPEDGVTATGAEAHRSPGQGGSADRAASPGAGGGKASDAKMAAGNGSSAAAFDRMKARWPIARPESGKVRDRRRQHGRAPGGA